MNGEEVVMTSYNECYRYERNTKLYTIKKIFKNK